METVNNLDKVFDTETKMKKSEISDLISLDVNFKALLEVYKKFDNTEAHVLKIDNQYKNGLSDYVYIISYKNTILNVIIPLFSSEKSITWDLYYIKSIQDSFPTEMKLEDDKLIEKIICPLYKYDKITTDIELMQVIKLSDFLNDSLNGKNGHSKYLFNDKLPNKHALSKSIIKSDIFVDLLPFYSTKELKNICKDFAVKYHAKFSTASKSRTEAQKINNISNGLYAQFYVYLKLKQEGYDVSMSFLNKDDLGIDIVLNTKHFSYNIDVKSTKTKDLKISKNRKETDFYAVVEWNKTNPVLKGFLFKFNFWKSDLIKSTQPEKKGDIYVKSLSSLKKNIVDIKELDKIKRSYEKQRIKKGQQLFNE